MVTTRHRPEEIWNRYNFPVSMEGCVFYAPLWQEDMRGTGPIYTYDKDFIPLTITGTTWDKYGRTMDGNDLLSYTVANFRSGDSSGAIEVWFKTGTTANSQILFGSHDTGTSTSGLRFYINQTTGLLFVGQQNAGDVADFVGGGTNVCDDVWHCAVLSSNGTAYSIILDGVAEALTVAAGANTGDWFADTTLRDNITIGAMTHTITVNFTIGTIGAVRIYSRPIGVGEANQHRQQELWRFAS